MDSNQDTSFGTLPTIGEQRPRKRRMESMEPGSTSFASLHTQSNQNEERGDHIPCTILELCTRRYGTVFEGDVLVAYGPAYPRNTGVQIKAEIVHIDLVDRNGQMTITVNISNNLIEMFLPRMLPGSSVRITNFLVKSKTKYERGDANCCLALTSKSIVNTVMRICKQLKLTPDKTISQLIQEDCSYSVGSFGAVITSYHLKRNQCELRVKDGDLQNDMATVVITNPNTDLYTKIENLLVLTHTPFILFKNVVRDGPKGTNIIRATKSTFLEELNDECTRANLQTLAKSDIQVTGTLRAKNAYQPPFEPFCKSCEHLILLDDSTTVSSVHCPTCITETEISFCQALQCTIHKEDGNIDCCLHQEPLQQNFPELANISYEQYNKDISTAVFLLCRFQIHGTFTLVENSIVHIARY
ncbi:uncharacterized protein LOC131066596 [Cryptomeria japonica]|uniref:uncharacterized protein LOC131066596 n=1 Tax=Cryptomeria japonica TaxID=3369 RepID=UPI0027D9E257|nr:uncharacterized protein LOC131066596 [Cryptomeria japonica]XP_057857388.2 uncharacterized protein LOC131066596 [Cryptomeria japonica]XP_057857389.2 uncharacterized protein LOC131066596 [Cryptomeria japonica]XP_057857390.2 uncharacterized protein LOC131066596 [Cryptomeria japonica]XP_057857391.2 uncharacterized protein LOC131066596 [Cryptomeria japonica]XP_057857392.2 uncharacterized protein LOC131066596 [Cryptomeria japonica]